VDLVIAHFAFAHGRGFKMVIQTSIKIDESKVQKDILNEIQRIINKNIPTIQNTLNSKIQKIVFQRLITGVPTVQGRDLYEIGIPDINNRLASVIRIVSESFEVKVSRGNLLRIDIGILRQGYAELLSLPEAIYRYTSAKGSGILEWLKWILLEGNGPIIGGFDFSPTYSGFSRTGGGVMVAGGNWTMPPSLAGTAQDNILTRALQNIEKDIEVLVKQELQRIIK